MKGAREFALGLIVAVLLLAGCGNSSSRTVTQSPRPSSSSPTATTVASLQGQIVVTMVRAGVTNIESHATFVVTAGGDLSSTQVNLPTTASADRVTYDAVARTMQAISSASLQPSPVTLVMRTTTSNLPAGFGCGFTPLGPFYLGAESAQISSAALTVLQRFGAYAHFARTAAGALVRATTYQGRLAWTLTVSVPSVPLKVGATALVCRRLTVTIDHATDFPLRVELANAMGSESLVLAVQDLVVNPVTTRAIFALDFPACLPTVDGQKAAETLSSAPTDAILAFDLHYRRVGGGDGKAIAIAAGLGSAAPLLPRVAAPGFVRSDITVVKSLETAAPMASLVYRRGLTSYTVTTGLVGPRYPVWRSTEGRGANEVGVSTDDPFAPSFASIGATTGLSGLAGLQAWKATSESIVLHGGYYSGKIARLVSDPAFLPHLYVYDQAFITTIAGALTRDEFINIAQSLHASP
ncbi:MAG: hypothetical protein ACLQUT_03635 [Thermoleophilia bacterium]